MNILNNENGWFILHGVLTAVGAVLALFVGALFQAIVYVWPLVMVLIIIYVIGCSAGWFVNGGAKKVKSAVDRERAQWRRERAERVAYNKERTERSARWKSYDEKLRSGKTLTADETQDARAGLDELPKSMLTTLLLFKSKIHPEMVRIISEVKNSK